MNFTPTKARLWSIFPFIFEQWNNHYVSNKRKTSLPEGRASELYRFLPRGHLVLTQIIIRQVQVKIDNTCFNRVFGANYLNLTTID